MIFRISRPIKFSNFYKKMNILSITLILLSIFVLLFKGLNLGVDFKGGTLIEIRTPGEDVPCSSSILAERSPDVTKEVESNHGIARWQDFSVSVDNFPWRSSHML